MVGHVLRVCTRLEAVSPFVINIHCIPYRTNSPALQAGQCVHCIKVSSEFDNILNLGRRNLHFLHC